MKILDCPYSSPANLIMYLERKKESEIAACLCKLCTFCTFDVLAPGFVSYIIVIIMFWKMWNKRYFMIDGYVFLLLLTRFLVLFLNLIIFIFF